jgi:hypothetical protein
MTTRIADGRALKNRPARAGFHRTDPGCGMRPGWLAGIGRGRIEGCRTLARRERPHGF